VLRTETPGEKSGLRLFESGLIEQVEKKRLIFKKK
jgi:hypothetical protein